jgi:hypothetical protein
MAFTPWLAAGGQVLASKFEQHDVRSLLPAESEVRWSPTCMHCINYHDIWLLQLDVFVLDAT